jgi:hypothetical protein
LTSSSPRKSSKLTGFFYLYEVLFPDSLGAALPAMLFSVLNLALGYSTTSSYCFLVFVSLTDSSPYKLLQCSFTFLLLLTGTFGICFPCSTYLLTASNDSNLNPFGSILLIIATCSWVAIRCLVSSTIPSLFSSI